MGKLVLGILFVILLQIAFFGFTSTYWSAPNESILAGKSRPAIREIHPSVQSQQIPPVASVTESTPSPPVKIPDARPAIERARVRTRSDSSDRVGKPRPLYQDRVINRPVPLQVRPENPQLSAVAPRRHTVVITDELAKMSSEKAPDVSKPKKRSFLSKSYSVVVKKPWSWMKSLASKLN